jgi:hypothetical protein
MSTKILMASARGLFQLNIETNVIDRLAMFRTAESWDAGSFVVWIFNVSRPILLKSHDSLVNEIAGQWCVYLVDKGESELQISNRAVKSPP